MLRATRSASILRNPVLWTVLGALAIIAAAWLAGCASDRTAAAIQSNEHAIADLRAEIRQADAQRAVSLTESEEQRWTAHIDALRAELDERQHAREGLIREHDEADERDAAAWSDFWTSAAGIATAAGIPVAGTIGGIIGTLRGRISGASVLAGAIARGRRKSPEFDAMFQDDTAPHVAAMKRATPARFVPVIARANADAFNRATIEA